MVPPAGVFATVHIISGGFTRLAPPERAIYSTFMPGPKPEAPFYSTVGVTPTFNFRTIKKLEGRSGQHNCSRYTKRPYVSVPPSAAPEIMVIKLQGDM